MEGVTASQRHVLEIMEKTFKVNIIEDPKAAVLKVSSCACRFTLRILAQRGPYLGLVLSSYVFGSSSETSKL